MPPLFSLRLFELLGGLSHLHCVWFCLIVVSCDQMCVCPALHLLPLSSLSVFRAFRSSSVPRSLLPLLCIILYSGFWHIFNIKPPSFVCIPASRVLHVHPQPAWQTVTHDTQPPLAPGARLLSLHKVIQRKFTCTSFTYRSVTTVETGTWVYFTIRWTNL